MRGGARALMDESTLLRQHLLIQTSTNYDWSTVRCRVDCCNRPAASALQVRPTFLPLLAEPPNPPCRSILAPASAGVPS